MLSLLFLTNLFFKSYPALGIKKMATCMSQKILSDCLLTLIVPAPAPGPKGFSKMKGEINLHFIKRLVPPRCQDLLDFCRHHLTEV